MKKPAAFRRLCVETNRGIYNRVFIRPAAFRRLCVETINIPEEGKGYDPAAFRRLCVETANHSNRCVRVPTSRLQAAVC